jgi:glycosyltransferase involved in cell wall biosynthesis
MGQGSAFLLEACSEARVEVDQLRLTTPERRESDQARLTVRSVRHGLALVVTFACRLVARRPSLVYLPIAQWGMPLIRDLCLVCVARVLRIRIVVHLHGSQLAERVSRPSSLLDKTVRRLLRRSRWAVLSSAIRELLVSSGAATCVHVVRNPAGSPARAASSPRTGSLSVGFLGVSCREKGLDVLVDAVENLRSRRSLGIQLLAAGPEWNYRPPSAEWLRYLGSVKPSDLDDLFWAHVDVLALPARWHEGLPFVVLEALQRRKLVFTTASLGLAELIEAGAVSTMSRDVDGCSLALERAYYEYPSLLTGQQAAWSRLRRRFDPESVRREWIYGLGLDGRPEPTAVG